MISTDIIAPRALKYISSNFSDDHPVVSSPFCSANRILVGDCACGFLQPIKRQRGKDAASSEAGQCATA